MKLIFPRPEVNEDGNAKNEIFARSLLLSYLSYNDIFIDEQDMEVSYNSCWHLWDISIYKDSRDKAGRGNREHRVKKWEEIKNSVSKVLPVSNLTKTWRDSKYYCCYAGTKLDEPEVEGIRFFIKTENNSCNNL